MGLLSFATLSYKIRDMPENINAHILIVEDDSGIANNLSNGLACEGYQLTWRDKRGEGIALAALLRNLAEMNLEMVYVD